MNNVFLWSWNPRSVGARLLSEALDIPRILHRNSRFQPTLDKLVINWGSTSPRGFVFLNPPYIVETVSNKFLFFEKMNDHCRCVPWTVSQVVAQEWNQKSTVIVRNLLTGHSGNGILVVPPLSIVPSAPLYTRYIPKDAEYRIHFVGNEIIDVQRKIRNPNREPTDWKVRSYSNGFIYIRRGLEVYPEDVRRQSEQAFRASGLEFGAVDVIWNEKKQQAFVLEINSAPGIMNTTVTKYADALRNLIQTRRERI